MDEKESELSKLLQTTKGKQALSNSIHEYIENENRPHHLKIIPDAYFSNDKKMKD